MNFDLTLLDEKQVFGENRLDILKKYGAKAATTDFSVLLGGIPAGQHFTNEGTTLKDRTSSWWTKSNYGNVIISVGSSGIGFRANIYMRTPGFRPALKYSLISKYASNNVVKNDIEEVEFGEYPQMVVDKNCSNELERLYNDNQLKQTGKTYTTDSVYFDDYSTIFCARSHIEYEYKGSKYIRFIADENEEGKILSDNRRVKTGKVYWLKVEPIIWLVDRKSDIALCKKIICSGVQFNNKECEIDFENNDIKHFMDKYLSKDIIPSNTKIEYYYYTFINYCGNECGEVCIDIFPYGPEKFSIRLMAYEHNGVLRDLLTDIELVPDNASFIDDNVLTYNRLMNANISCIFEKLLQLESIKQQNELLLTKIKCEYIKYISALTNNSNLIDTYNQALINETIKDYLLLRRK